MTTDVQLEARQKQTSFPPHHPVEAVGCSPFLCVNIYVNQRKPTKQQGDSLRVGKGGREVFWPFCWLTFSRTYLQGARGRLLLCLLF